LLRIIVTLAFLVQGIALWGTAGAVVGTRQAERLSPYLRRRPHPGRRGGRLVTRPLAAGIGTAYARHRRDR
jgi:hypothetical protein